MKGLQSKAGLQENGLLFYRDFLSEHWAVQEKSKCLKLYCECLKAEQYCNKFCQCCNCHNNEEHKIEIEEAKNKIIDRDPKAFKKQGALDVFDREWMNNWWRSVWWFHSDE